MKPGKYYYSEPFATWFRALLEEREAINARKAAGTYEAGPQVTYPVDPDPPTGKQIGLLKRLGAKTMPKTKREASDMIGKLLEKKDEV